MRSKALLFGLLATSALATNALTISAFAQETTNETAAPSSQVGEIVVSANNTAGGGQMVAASGSQVVETISKEFIADLGPSSNPAMMIQNLPSVNISNPDAFGLAGGANVQIHGLNTADLGFVLDGAPVYNSGAAYSNETIDAHDLTTVSVTPGTATIDAPTIGSAAGTMYLTMRDPAHQSGLAFDFAVGSQAYNMQYLRLESGDIGNTGIRAFASLSHGYANNWRGGGYNNKWHLDFKAVKDWSNGSRFSLEGSVNRQTYTYYYYPTADQFKNYKADYNDFNIHSHYEGFGDTSYYRLNQQTPSYAIALLAPLHVVVGEHVVLDDTPYFWAFLGAGTGGSVLTQGSAYHGTQLANVDLTDGGRITPTDGQVLVDSAFRSRTYQYGNVAKGSITTGDNKIVAGWWHEHYVNFERDPVAMVDQTSGKPINPWKKSGWYHLANGNTYFSNDSNQIYNLDSLFIGDTLSLMNDALKISAGGKYVSSRSQVKNHLPGADPLNRYTFRKFLPQGQLSYKFDEKFSVYADIEQDFRQPYLTAVLDTYSISSGEQESGASEARPERATKEEIGFRYKSGLLLADVSVFNINLKDHLLSLTELVNGQPLTSTANAGKQRSRGVDVQIGTKPIDHFSPYLSFEYLDSRTESDIADINEAGAQDYLPTKNKYSTQAPKFQVAAGLTYRSGGLTIGGRARWVDKQYATLMNDEKMPSYIDDQYTLAYTFKKVGMLAAPKIQLNVQNLFNRRYRTGVYSTLFNASDTQGRNGGTIASAGSPEYYVAPRFTVAVSVSSTF